MKHNTRIIFHIGLTKTGTTFLQKSVFPYLFSKYNYDSKSHSLHSFRKGLYLRGKTNFWSEEDSWMGGVDPKRFSYKRANFWKSINYLREKVSDIRLILVLRDQESWLKSLYLHDAKTKGRFGGLSLDQYASLFENNYIYWSHHLDSLQDFKILLLNYEDLKNNQEKFIKAICDFSDLSVKDNLVYKIVKNNKNESNQFVNITPNSDIEMMASRLFSKYEYQFSLINAAFRRINFKRQITRDLFIRLARQFPKKSSNVIENLYLQDSQLKQKFAQDWEETWKKAKSLPNVKTLDDFF